MGASVLADVMKDRDDFWLTREQYQEYGKQIVHQDGTSKR
jgi:actin-related protein